LPSTPARFSSGVRASPVAGASVSALPSWRLLPVLAVLPSDVELEDADPDFVALDDEELVLGVEGIEGMDDELGDGMLGTDGAPLVAHPASMAAHSALTDNSEADRIRFLR
jgi:hypothetical protein